jgi:hypothetical protein
MEEILKLLRHVSLYFSRQEIFKAEFQSLLLSPR